MRSYTFIDTVLHIAFCSAGFTAGLFSASVMVLKSITMKSSIVPIITSLVPLGNRTIKYFLEITLVLIVPVIWSIKP